MEIVQTFKEGGPWMYAVLALDMFVVVAVATSLALAVAARARPQTRGVAFALGLMALLASGLPMLVGGAGYWFSMQRVEAVLPMVDPEHRDELARVGEEEASHNLTFGFGSGFVFLLPAALGLVLLPPKQP